MRLIKELSIIILFSLLGEVISMLLSNIIVVPGSIIGMLLLFFSLHYKVIKLEAVEKTGTWLTTNMAIFFIPAGVGLIADFETLAKTWWQLAIIVIITTIFMMVIIGMLVQKLKERFEKNKGEKNHVE